MKMVVLFLLIVPFVQCPVMTMASRSGRADFNSLSEHINMLEQQVNTLHYEFETELRSTLIELVNVKSELKASQEEQISLRRDLGEKCRMLKMTSSELNTTKHEIARLKVEAQDVKLTCSQRPSLNITDIVAAINSTVSFKAEFKEELKEVNNRETIIFNKVITNEGGGYNVKNGTFKAPNSGTYMAWVDIYIPETCSFINVLAQKEGQIIGRSKIDFTSREVIGDGFSAKSEGDVIKDNCLIHRGGEETEESYVVLEQREITDKGHNEAEIGRIQIVLEEGETIEESYLVHDKKEAIHKGHSDPEKREIIGNEGEKIGICYPCQEEEVRHEQRGFPKSHVLRKATISFVTHFKKGEKLWLTKDSGCLSIYSHKTWPRSGFGCILLRPGSLTPS